MLCSTSTSIVSNVFMNQCSFDIAIHTQQQMQMNMAFKQEVVTTLLFDEVIKVPVE